MIIRNNDNQQKEFTKFLKLLNDNELLGTVVVVGSWCEYIYAQSGILKGFSASLRTLDADFLIKNLRIPNTPTNLTSLAREAGYIVMSDSLNRTTKILTENGLEIEFLITQLGRGDKPVLKTNLGVNAQSLRHMDIILKNTITIDYYGMNTCVPSPEAYVIHKMIINKERTVAKQKKDSESIYHLIPYLDLVVFKDIYDKLFKKEQKAVDDFCQQHSENIELIGKIEHEADIK